jgi:hypothetical protein
MLQKKKEKVDILGVFLKPQKVTEEEVTVSKEKKICLVCKGKVGRFDIFLCPDCNALYCSKCSNALIDLENACWACETAIDESKPVKIEEKQRVDSKIADKHKKTKIKK